MNAPKELRVSKDRRTLTVSYHDHESFERAVEIARESPELRLDDRFHYPTHYETLSTKRGMQRCQITSPESV